MSETTIADPILPRIKKELDAMYGPRLKQALLYGSRARGDQEPDSDYDVLVVLEPPFDYWEEVYRLSDFSTNLIWETVDWEEPVVVSFKVMTPDQFEARTGFLHNVRREAISL